MLVQDQVEIKVRTILEQFIEIPIEEVEVEDLLIAIGIDSNSFIRLLVKLEEEFNFIFDDTDLSLDRIETVKCLIENVKAKGRGD